MRSELVSHEPTPKELKERLPLEDRLKRIVVKRQQEIINVLFGNDPRILLYIGPCSADYADVVVPYIVWLKELQEKKGIKENVLIVPRIYTAKPRTNGEGYTGIQEEGIYAVRNIHVKSLQESELPAADEMLNPFRFKYLDDNLLACNILGARSCETQKFRFVASGIDGPVGIKNPTSGDLTVLVDSIHAVKIPHQLDYIDDDFRPVISKTEGNPYAHAILRGSAFKKNRKPNYNLSDINELIDAYSADKDKIAGKPVIIVDTNHDNSMKNPDMQPKIMREIMGFKKQYLHIHQAVKGFMTEAYCIDGRQDNLPGQKGYKEGLSKTDPCIGKEKTKRFVYDLAELNAALPKP